jgi:outer membrane protein assembly factor BamB
VWRKTLRNLDGTFVASAEAVLVSAYPTESSGGIAYPGGADSETELRALGLSDGAVRWQVNESGSSLASPPFVFGEWACVGYANESINVVNMDTGEIKWDLPMALVSGPIEDNGIVLAVAADEVGADGSPSIEGYVCAVAL